jgi:hypothetical protein
VRNRNPNPEIPSAALMAALAEALAAYEARDDVRLLRARARILEVILKESEEE